MKSYFFSESFHAVSTNENIEIQDGAVLQFSEEQRPFDSFNDSTGIYTASSSGAFTFFFTIMANKTALIT